MGKRTDLQIILEGLLGSDYVYFQPPATKTMSYPCIRYTYGSGHTIFADDNPYSFKRSYQVTVITRDPDSATPAKVGALSLCRFDRPFTSDNLHHFVYNLYY